MRKILSAYFILIMSVSYGQSDLEKKMGSQICDCMHSVNDYKEDVFGDCVMKVTKEDSALVMKEIQN